MATIVYRREQGPRRFGRKLIRERLAGRHIEDPLACGEGPRLSTELPDREVGPCEGFLARGSIDEIWLAVHRGGARGGRLSVDGACNQEPDGYRDTRHKIYTGSDRQCDVKPYVLCSVICIDLG